MFDWAFEWKLEDMWVGIFWKWSDDVIPTGFPAFAFPVYDRLDIWICLVPCIPLHIVYWIIKK